MGDGNALHAPRSRRPEDGNARERPIPPVPVANRVFCTFSDCPQCAHGFNESYLRSYRPNGLKVLRCFPHCCPTHMLNSTCGTSVMMQIAGQFSPTEALSFVTFARFETTMDPPSFHVGNCVPFAEFADSDSKSSPWYPGALSTNSADDDLLMRYTFNEHMQRPWSYGWTSSASAALRNTLHVFKAYLLCSNGNDTLVVVGMAQSQAFSIVPYKSAVADRKLHRPTSSSLAPPQPPTTAPSRTVAPSGSFSCEFVPCACDKPQFTSSYIRCNRSNGRKQLRCFPHCCPEHNLHCSCGGPIAVAVDMTHPIEGEIVMYAHGERVDDAEFALNQVVAHDVILSRLHEPGQNDRGDWVPGIFQPSQSTERRLVFNLNENSTHLGWPYNWKGSATKVDRNQQHVLKAYVFQLSPDNTALRVLNWIASTPFTMSSFRRSNTTPTSRTNKYIQVIPTEITDQSLQVLRKKVPASRKRQHDHVELPTTLLNEINSAG
ncbi:hypothetical protein H310_09916 [Aphanomyces invadans]|uniref:Uncharacterized protein n=1 Tax=Aphanomyces invadans TaxID=157072 RepID=A0A024TUT5_9STRA|nr:hypothetical protein H310_09916 [Aphanomyces invadans]ETV97107.1 hypothetical protein H310_09916 [Aphanomyces invadans]|eukprot:XP_008874353.1 hypothetical protein H310_09916 [Aphanomyces invadans]